VCCKLAGGQGIVEQQQQKFKQLLCVIYAVNEALDLNLSTHQLSLIYCTSQATGQQALQHCLIQQLGSQDSCNSSTTPTYSPYNTDSIAAKADSQLAAAPKAYAAAYRCMIPAGHKPNLNGCTLTKSPTLLDQQGLHQQQHVAAAWGSGLAG
jgi:hypothetical protein